MKLKLVELKTDKPVYACHMQCVPQEETGEDASLVTFTGESDEYHYADGSAVKGVLKFNRALWEAAGCPTTVMVAFSEEEFVAIPRRAYDAIREELTW